MGKTGEAKTGETRTGDLADRAPSWLLDGERLETVIAEERTHRELNHVYRVDRETLDDQLAPLRQTAEKVDVVTRSDGSFRARDRAAADGSHELRPPATRRPPRTVLTAYVAGYDQRAIDAEIDRHEVTVTWQVDANREPGGTAIDEAQGAGDWLFALRSAAVATSRVTVDVREGTPENVEVLDLTVVLDADQALVIEESLTRLAAVGTDEVPDAENAVADDSADPPLANTLTLLTPDASAIEGRTGQAKTGEAPTGGGIATSDPPVENGQYVCRDWRGVWVSDAAVRYSLSLAKA